MKLKSLIQNANRLEVAEVEIEFIPGIPQIHFLGLPDRLIKESFYRIKSALKSCGYKFPLTSQMIVNIKPNHLRKSSRGVELAVALGILLKTDQIEASLIKPEWVIYGELGLDGNIYEPSDLAQSMIHLKDFEVLTGRGQDSTCYRIESLNSPEISFTTNPKKIKRPEVGIYRLYTEQEAEFLFLAATSGLHSLLAGDSGAGKSTLAHSLNSFLPEPHEDQQIRFDNNWRPVIAPHQSITPAAFIGGGANLFEGEVERVQGGILLLDELLEFDPEILESLRGPMTGEKLRISRGSGFRELNCDFQVVATTNLCPCGKWTPLKKNISCRFSRMKCSRYLEKFSGPILDRFGILLYSTHREKRKISGSHILKRVQSFLEFSAKNPELLLQTDQPEVLETYYQNLTTRRKNYLLKVASIYALESFAQGSSELKPKLNLIHHYNRAEQWVIRPFEQLEKGMS
jgi:magnesium chelatase family protein